MRDVIVIGCGGGGPVVAKELAAKGLDVLVLEGGPWYRDPEHEWSRFENDANNPVDGYFRYGPSHRFKKPAWFRETPQNSFLWQLAGVGGTTQHYYGNCPRAAPGVFAGYSGADASAYDTAHRFPFSYEHLVPYYEWVEATLPVQTAPMGTKEETYFRGAEGIGLPVNATKDISRNSFRPQENAILQPSGNARKTTDRHKLLYPKAKGCTFCGYCFQGCFEPRHAPRNLKAKRSTDNSYVPMMLTADAWSKGGKPATLMPNAYVIKVLTEGGATGNPAANGVVWRDTRTGDEHTETAKVVVMSGGCTEDPRLWLNSGLPNPNAGSAAATPTTSSTGSSASSTTTRAARRASAPRPAATFPVTAASRTSASRRRSRRSRWPSPTRASKACTRTGVGRPGPGTVPPGACQGPSSRRRSPTSTGC
jgi:choline dehydrogenase-like flavoprotein